MKLCTESPGNRLRILMFNIGPKEAAEGWISPTNDPLGRSVVCSQQSPPLRLVPSSCWQTEDFAFDN